MLEMLDKPGFLLVVIAGILIFGAKRLPDSARALGRSMRILKAESKGLREDDVVVKKVDLGVSPTPAVDPVESPTAL
jgi:sec-independent protein translocase protein TatA